MKARNFRYLFENADDGIVHTGCIWDTTQETRTNFAYVCGVRNKRESEPGTQEMQLRFERTEQPCHIFVLASFSVRYIKALLKMVRAGRVETVLLPYVAPIQRMAISQWCSDGMKREPDFQRFMERPYSYLKGMGVENVYVIYGNGENWRGQQQQLIPGHHFELVDDKELQIIKELEGAYVPVVKAGYMIVNDWLFYFGHFGSDIDLYKQFGYDSKGYKKNVHIYYQKNSKQVLHEYSKKSSDIIASSIAMFHTPLDTRGEAMDSVMTGKVFSKEKQCMPYFEKDGFNCLFQCIHGEDYAIYRKHKGKDVQHGCFGMLALGNVNLSRYLPEIGIRFRNILTQVRAVTIPGCGNRNFWNCQCLSLIFGESIKYWICGLDRSTSPGVISDVVVSSPKNRIVTISKEFGYCFSGYLVPRVEDVL